MWGMGKDAGEGRKPHSHICSDMFGHTCCPMTHLSPLRVSGVCQSLSQPQALRDRFCWPTAILSDSSNPSTVNTIRDPVAHHFIPLPLYKPPFHLKNGSNNTASLLQAQRKSVLGEHMQTPALTFIMDGETEAQRDQLVVSNLHCVLGSPGELVENKGFQVLLPAWGRSLVICTF